MKTGHKAILIGLMMLIAVGPAYGQQVVTSNQGTPNAGGSAAWWVQAIGISKNTAYTSQTGQVDMGFVETSAAAGTNGNLDFVSLTLNRAMRQDIASIAGSTVVADPCQVNTPTYSNINISTATTTLLVAAGGSSKKTYVCSIDLFAFSADNVAIVEGTQSTTPCDTGAAGLVGGTTTATGISFPAQGGLVKGTGQSAVWVTAGTNVQICAITSASVQLSGRIKTVSQ